MKNEDEQKYPPVSKVQRWTASTAEPSASGGFVAYGDYLELQKWAQDLERQIVYGHAHIQELEKQVQELQKQVVSGFYEEKFPRYTQGIPTNELQSTVTAEECNGMVSRMAGLSNTSGALRKALARLIKEIEQDIDTRKCRVSMLLALNNARSLLKD